MLDDELDEDLAGPATGPESDGLQRAGPTLSLGLAQGMHFQAQLHRVGRDACLSVVRSFVRAFFVCLFVCLFVLLVCLFVCLFRLFVTIVCLFV